MKLISWISLGVLSQVCISNAQPFLQTLVTEGLFEPYGVAVDQEDRWYVTDTVRNRIVRYSPTIQGITNFVGFAGASGAVDGKGPLARFFNPQGIVFLPDRNSLAVADSGNHTIRLVSLSGEVTTWAGLAGVSGSADGLGQDARFNSPSGVAVDGDGNVFVADTLNHQIRRIDGTSGEVTTLANNSGFPYLRPTAVAVDPVGVVYVADTGHNRIRAARPDGTVEVFAGTGVVGSDNALLATEAQFNRPRGLLWVGGSTGLLVSDSGNAMIRQVVFDDLLSVYSVRQFGNFGGSNGDFVEPIGLAMDNFGDFAVVDLGSDTLFKIQATVAQAPVADPLIGRVFFTTNSFGQLRTAIAPIVNATFNNDVLVAILGETGTETYYTLDPGADFPDDPTSRNTPHPYSNGLLEWTSSIVHPGFHGPEVDIRAIGISDGRRPSAIAQARIHFKVSSTIINGDNPGGFTLENTTQEAELWYTTDGSTPINSAPSKRYEPGTKLNVVNGVEDVTFKVRGFKSGYEPSEVTTKLFHFEDLQSSLIGFTRDFLAGVGSTIVVPVEVKVADDEILRSLQFRVEVIPGEGAPPLDGDIKFVSITTNDFVRVEPPSIEPPVVMTYTSNGTTRGISLSYIGGESGLELEGSKVVAHLAVPIPANAMEGQTYDITLLEPSGTSDGLQSPVILSIFSSHRITVSNLPYIVGDTAVGTGYNAGDFGNGNLNNNDVNNAFYASLGLWVPYPFTDAFDAMDSWPEDTSLAVGGDGQIRFLDWQVILRRSLRLSQDNWARIWGVDGVRTVESAQLNGVAQEPADEESLELTDKVWNRPARIWVQSADQVVPGTRVEIPVCLEIWPDRKVAGLQFRAVVVPLGDAPELLEPVSFVDNPNLPLGNSRGVVGIPGNQVVRAWNLNPEGIEGLEGKVVLGTLECTIPEGAVEGSCYLVRFMNADGAPGFERQFDFESTHGKIWVDIIAPEEDEVLSDEWKIHFLGSLDHPMGRGKDDADGDGVDNEEEYRRGTDPVDLRFHPVSPDANRGLFPLRWFGKQGVKYRIQKTTDLTEWKIVAEGVAGENQIKEIFEERTEDQSVFYRIETE